jgi:hypothetical protein
VNVSPVQVGMARILMEHGSSMTEAAVHLGVRSADLDLAMWRNIGTALDELVASRPRRASRRRYAPAFD